MVFTNCLVVLEIMYMKQVIEEEIEDFDVRSLYPKSIKRIGDEMGFPIGPCSKLNLEEGLPLVCYNNRDYSH